MSLAAVSGKVSKTIAGSNLTNAANTALFGNSPFLRNHERGIDKLTGAVDAGMSILETIGDLTGVRSDMYKIGEIQEDAGLLGNLANKAIRAVSFGLLSNGLEQQGVIIDGFDNFKGDIGVALAEQPVMYQTAVSDNRVRNPNRLTMRVYVDLVHTDDLMQNILQKVKDSFGGLAGKLLGAITGDTMNRAQKALNNLQWIQENGKAFKVYTPHKVYENMMIEKISPINDLKMNEILAADITFKEIIYCKPISEGYSTPARLAVEKAQSTAAQVLGWFK